MKLDKRWKKVNCKVDVGKDFHWKIFSSFVGDLECRETGNDMNLSFSDSERKLFDHSIRTRDQILLSTVVSEFTPRCMCELPLDNAAFFARYQVASFLKKFPAKGPDSKKKAIEKFFKFEKICHLFNTENYRALLQLDKYHPDYYGIIHDIRKDILSLIGPVPNLDTIYGLAYHGPGATVDSKQHSRGETTSYFKWSKLPYTVTADCAPLLREAILADVRWISALYEAYRLDKSIPYTQSFDMASFWNHVLKIVDGSRTAVVPKSFDEGRTIALEPTGNVFLQLGVDRFIRGRLKRRWNIDLNTQEVNQLQAYLASIDGRKATIDLRGASDCVSLMVTDIYLPVDWYNLLCLLRSPSTTIDGEGHVLHKISSMGNGFTFALESLLFAAFARAILERQGLEKSECVVYGDDIIVPTTCSERLIAFLALNGFDTNVDKTFISGPFRESCGTDWIRGTDVRPIFLKKAITTLQDLFFVHNSLWRLEARLDWVMGFDFSRTRKLILSRIPLAIKKRYFGPPSENLDTYLFSDLPIRQMGNGLGLHWALVPRAVKFNKEGSSFKFRRLMVALKTKPPLNPWSKKLPDTGNAFDITKRDRVGFYPTLVPSWRTP